MDDVLVSIFEQLRYEQLCVTFTKMVDLVVASEEWSKHLLGWIEFQTNKLSTSKCNRLEMHRFEARNDESINILDQK